MHAKHINVHDFRGSTRGNMLEFIFRAKYSKALCSLTAVALLSGCAANMKPDHPQVYESFRDRRAPKENQLVSTGLATQLPAQPSSHFTPYTGLVMGSTNSATTATAPATQSQAAADVAKAKPQAQPQISSSPSDSISDQPSFWERFKNKFVNTSFLDSRITPQENKQAAADIHMTMAYGGASPYVEQGSAAGYSYYDMAEDIYDRATIMHLAAAGGASAPLVLVPQEESIEAMKEEGTRLPKPDLKTVPPKDSVMKNQHVTARQEHKATPSPQVEPVEKLDVNPVGESGIQDPTARVENHNGRAVVTGTLGVLRDRVKGR